MMRKAIFLVFLFLLPVAANATTESSAFDHSLLDQFLKKYVNDRGEVNYRAAAGDSGLLKQYLDKLSNLESAAIGAQWPREERLALWLNAYHAGVLQTILSHYPVRSLLEIPGIWDIDVIKVGTRHLSLNNIRQYELIGNFRDEKIDVALACGARSCPELSRDAYTGPQVEGQLYLAARRFVNDLSRNQIEPGQKKIRISKIFKWYGNDFKLDFASEERDHNFSDTEYAVLSFLANYLKDEKKVQFLEEGNYKLRYADFDWSLNEWHPENKKP